MKRKLPYPIPLLRLKIRLYALSFYSKAYHILNITELSEKLYSYEEIHECFDFGSLKATLIFSSFLKINSDSSRLLEAIAICLSLIILPLTFYINKATHEHCINN